MKNSTKRKYINIIKEISESGLTIYQYIKNNNKSQNLFNQLKQANESIVDDSELNNLYSKYYSIVINRSRNKTNKNDNVNLFSEIENNETFIDSSPEDDENQMKWWATRDENNNIIKYHVYYPSKDYIPFTTTLTREDAEQIFGLYTYYGGNITARNVANEFPKYTLPEIKKIFRVFKLTKDSIWVPPHLVEELTEPQLAQYRMSLKEKAAFKYCDAQQEKDFNLQIKKMASQINKLSSYKEIVKDLLNADISVTNTKPTFTYNNSTTGIICLADLHIGAHNTSGGYIPLPDYNEEEINRRLDFIYKEIACKNWTNVIVLNLGDNIDSYKKMTTSMTHELPCVISDKEMAMMYLRVMKRFFTNLTNTYDSVQYYSIGDGNHSGTVGWLNDLILSQHLKELNIESYVSNNSIDSLDVNGTSFLYLHGKASADKGQYKGFPLNLDIKTENWFNNFFYDTPLKLNKRKVVLKGDLHQFSINSCTTFDYINCPSLYGSSSYIVSNFGYTKWGCTYLEVNSNGTYTTGTIRE